jgi:hypothetical protein
MLLTSFQGFQSKPVTALVAIVSSSIAASSALASEYFTSIITCEVETSQQKLEDN